MLVDIIEICCSLFFILRNPPCALAPKSVDKEIQFLKQSPRGNVEALITSAKKNRNRTYKNEQNVMSDDFGPELLQKGK